MANTKEGALKARAKKHGMTVEEYQAQIDAGLSWCWHCKQWLPVSKFGSDSTRHDGLNRECYSCHHSRYVPRKRTGPSPLKGRKHSPEHRAKSSEARKGNKNRLGKPFTAEARQRISAKLRLNPRTGARNHNWKGGPNNPNLLERRNAKYLDWRTSVFTRDGFTCQHCGDSRGGNLNAHHIKEWSKYPELRFEVSNGLTLCETCHTELHRGKRK